MPPTLTHVDLGEAVRLVVTLRNPAGDQLEDGTVTVTATGPTATQLTATVNRMAQGRYEAFFTPDVSGTWTVSVNVSGARTAVEYGLVRVRPAP